MLELQLEKAIKRAEYGRIAIHGPSKSGRTYTALTFAAALAGDDPVVVIDCEHRGSEKYADLFDFSIIEVTPPYAPARLMEALRLADRYHAGAIVIDGMSQFYDGSGGLLDHNSALAKEKYNGNTFAAWNESIPLHRDMIETMLAMNAHVVFTIYSGTGSSTTPI